MFCKRPFTFPCVRRACLGLAAVLLIAGSARSQGTGVIEGFVRDRQGKAQSNMTLVLKGGAGIQVDRTHTDQEGHYAFFQIGAGVFFITLEIAGVPTESRRVEFVTNEMGGHRREDFTLEKPDEARRQPFLEPVFVQNVPPAAEKEYRQALILLRSGKRDEAVQSLTRAVQQFPAYYDAWNALGLEYLKQNNATKAGPAFQRALAANRNSASARFGVGWAFYQAERLTDAARELTEAARLNPRVAETYWFLGRAQLERKQWLAAEQAFTAYRKINPRDDRPALHLYLTSIYDALGRRAAAVDELETYLKTIPEKERTAKLRDLLSQLKRKRDQATSK